MKFLVNYAADKICVAPKNLEPHPLEDVVIRLPVVATVLAVANAVLVRELVTWRNLEKGAIHLDRHHLPDLYLDRIDRGLNSKI